MNHLIAPVQFTAFPGLDPATEVVVVLPPGFEIAEYQGTRAALEAEGVIPAGTAWPEGFADLRWEDGPRHYWLRRKRPEGQKGPRRQFLDVDWWMLRCEPQQVESFGAREVKRRVRALADYIHGQSPEGQAESTRREHGARRAREDKAFQAFKATCGIGEKERGRKASVAREVAHD